MKTFRAGQKVWVRRQFGSFVEYTYSHRTLTNGEQYPHCVTTSAGALLYYADHEVFTEEDYAAFNLTL